MLEESVQSQLVSNCTTECDMSK